MVVGCVSGVVVAVYQVATPVVWRVPCVGHHPDGVSREIGLYEVVRDGSIGIVGAGEGFVPFGDEDCMAACGKVTEGGIPGAGAVG